MHSLLQIFARNFSDTQASTGNPQTGITDLASLMVLALLTPVNEFAALATLLNHG